MTRLRERTPSLHQRLLNEGWEYLGNLMIANGDMYDGIAFPVERIGSHTIDKPTIEQLTRRYRRDYNHVRLENPRSRYLRADHYRVVYVRGKRKKS